MPINPFTGNSGIGSRGNERNIASEARAVRAYDTARKRLLATLSAEQEALVGINAAHTATMKSRMRDHAQHSKELLKTSSLLDAQGDTLKNLGSIRERFHREEMSRTESLLQRYESIKQALKEIQEDYKDSTTVLGYLFTPIAEGIDNLSKFGTVGKASRPIQDVTFDLKTLGSDTVRAADSVVNLGVAFTDTVGQVRRYEASVDHLNETAAKLDLRFGTASGHAKKLQENFINLSRTDIDMEGSVKSVEAVTHSLMMLEAQGVDSQAVVDLIVTQSKTSGRSYEDVAESVEHLTAQSDNLREMLEATGGTLGRFTATVRDDFVRAIADATRNLDSQVISVENVGAAYAYASMKAAHYGASTKSAHAISEAFVKASTEERHDAAGFLAGQNMANDMLQRQKKAIDELVAETPGRKASDFRYETASPEEQRRIRDAVFASNTSEYGGAETDSNRMSRENSMRILGEGGLSNTQLYNINRGTDAAIRAQIRAVQSTIGVGNVAEDSVRAPLRAQILGMSNLTDDQQITMDRLFSEGSEDEIVEGLRQIREEATARTETQAAPMEQALSAIATMKDPIQSLFNMKEYLKSIMLNVSNIVSFMSRMGGVLGNIGGLVNPDTSADIIAAETKADSAARSAETEGQRQQAILKLTQDLAASAGDANKSAAITQALSATSRMQATTQQALSRAQTEQQRAATAPVPTQNDALSFAAPAALAASTVDSVRSMISTIGIPESGRSQGIASVGNSRQYSDVQQLKQQQAAPPPAGDMVAVGTGKATVTPAGESVMNVRMVITNMSELIAHYSTGEARLQRAL